jgi:hypothetical protein
MQAPVSTENVSTTPEGKPAIQPDFSTPAVPIGQFTERPDWPQCVLGLHVSIHGFEGVVIEVINHSIRVISAERITQRFNASRLKTLFAPMDRSRPEPPPVAEGRNPAAVPEPAATAERPASAPSPARRSMAPAPTPIAPPQPATERITHPDFSAPVRAIRTYAGERDFPGCALGKHVDIRGYSGVVVEIEGGALKVQAPDGTFRSFVASNLRKVYGRD